MKKFIIPIIILLITVSLIVVTMKVDVQPIGPDETEIGFASINGAFHELTGVHMAYYGITNIIGYLSILGGLVFAFMGLRQLIQRKKLISVDKEILALGVLYILLGVLYALFEKVAVNYRPIIMPGVARPEPSFPSSHTMLIVTVLISIAIIVKKYVEKKGRRKFIQFICVLVSIIAVALRLLSGVHWLTDIVCGLFISATLLTFYAASIKRDESALDYALKMLR